MTKELAPGLALHLDVVPDTVQSELLAFTDGALRLGREGKLDGHTYLLPPQEWAQAGQSRECLLYGVFVKCNKVASAPVQPIPAPLLSVLDLLEQQGVFLSEERPDTCCVNAYEPGMWLPPHVDSAKFARPFFTVSLLSEQEVVFGETIEGADGAWEGALRVGMPPGSVLRVDGAAADEMKHALPRATARRVSLTFRRLSSSVRGSLDASHGAVLASREAKAARKREAKAARGRVPLSARLAAGSAPDRARLPREAQGSRHGEEAGSEEASGEEWPWSCMSDSALDTDAAQDKCITATTAVGCGNEKRLDVHPTNVHPTTVTLLELPSGGMIRVHSLPSAATAEEVVLGGVVWPAARSLCEWLADHVGEIQGSALLELGAGTGACGLFAAGLGASRVVITEGGADAGRLTPLMHQNVTTNGLAGRVEVCILDWGDVSALPPGPFDWIVGSDVAWGADEDSHRHLCQALCALLQRSPPHTRAILAVQHGLPLPMESILPMAVRDPGDLVVRPSVRPMPAPLLCVDETFEDLRLCVDETFEDLRRAAREQGLTILASGAAGVTDTGALLWPRASFDSAEVCILEPRLSSRLSHLV